MRYRCYVLVMLLVAHGALYGHHNFAYEDNNVVRDLFGSIASIGAMFGLSNKHDTSPAGTAGIEGPSCCPYTIFEDCGLDSYRFKQFAYMSSDELAKMLENIPRHERREMMASLDAIRDRLAYDQAFADQFAHLDSIGHYKAYKRNKNLFSLNPFAKKERISAIKHFISAVRSKLVLMDIFDSLAEGMADWKYRKGIPERLVQFYLRRLRKEHGDTYVSAHYDTLVESIRSSQEFRKTLAGVVKLRKMCAEEPEKAREWFEKNKVYMRSWDASPSVHNFKPFCIAHQAGTSPSSDYLAQARQKSSERFFADVEAIACRFRVVRCGDVYGREKTWAKSELCIQQATVTLDDEQLKELAKFEEKLLREDEYEGSRTVRCMIQQARIDMHQCKGTMQLRLYKRIRAFYDMRKHNYAEREAMYVLNRHAKRLCPLGGLERYSGNDVQHNVHEEIVGIVNRYAYYAHANNAKETALFEAAGVALGLKQKLDGSMDSARTKIYERTYSFLDFCHNWLKVAVGRRILYITQCVGKGFEQGWLDIKKLWGNSVKHYWHDVLHEHAEDIIAGKRSVLEIASQHCVMGAGRLKESVAHVFEQIREQPLGETAGEAIQLLSRAFMHASVTVTAALCVVVAVKAGATAVTTISGAMAAKSVLEPLVMRFGPSGAVALEKVSSWTLVWGSVVAAAGQLAQQVQEVLKVATNLGVAMQGGGPEGGETKKSGTVWDDIRPTQECYPGTKIPRSFELRIGKYKFWVHGNATKHMKEYLIRFGGESFSTKLRSQVMLKSFYSSVQEAIAKWNSFPPGRYFGKFGAWELGINTETGVIYHALMK